MRESMESLKSLPLCAPGMALRRIHESRLVPCDTRIHREHDDALVRELGDDGVEHPVVCVREKM